MDDRRVFERIPASVSLRLLDVVISRELEANTFDVSAKGLGIVSKERLIAGDSLELWLKIPDQEENFYARGIVVWTRASQGENYRAGISLEKAEFMQIARILRNKS